MIAQDEQRIRHGLAVHEHADYLGASRQLDLVHRDQRRFEDRLLGVLRAVLNQTVVGLAARRRTLAKRVYSGLTARGIRRIVDTSPSGILD